MDMQEVKELSIPEGGVRTIHDGNGNLLWGKLAYDTRYNGDTLQNGTPSPDAPVSVQVVTGTQTITVSDGVNSYNYALNLGSIELCKIGTYQDSIYKSGSEWYAHKEIGKAAFNGSENWLYVDSRTLTDRFTLYIAGMGLAPAQNGFCNNNKFVNAGVSSDIQATGISGSSLYFRINKNIIGSTSEADFKNWVSNNNITIYTVLSTPTDTKITDATLISQLDAVHQFLTRYGYNATVTGNLPLIVDRTNL